MLKGNLNRSYIKFVCYWEIVPNHDEPRVNDAKTMNSSNFFIAIQCEV